MCQARRIAAEGGLKADGRDTALVTKQVARRQAWWLVQVSSVTSSVRCCGSALSPAISCWAQ